MLDWIDIRDFRSLRQVSVSLRPLTVLIGPNDSGKSSFLAAIRYLVDHVRFQPIDLWRGSPEAKATIQGRVPDLGQATVSTDGIGGDTISHSLRPLGFFHLLSHEMPMESGGQAEDSGPPTIATTGQGVSSVVDFLLRTDRQQFDRFVAEVRSLIPGVQDVLVATPHPANRRLDLVIEGGFRLDANRASSGVRMLLVFLALAYHPAPPKVILVEEPETAIHPRRLGDVMRLLREMTNGKHGGQAVQVILTTHSPYLLDHVDPKEDQVLVFRREKDGACTVEPADVDRLAVFLDEFLLGEVWFNEGESGLTKAR